MGRIPVGNDNGVEFRSETPSFDDMVFGFFEGDSSFDSVASDNFEEDEEQPENSIDQANKNRAFWESQHQILQNTLFRTSSTESKVRQETKEALNKGITCSCQRPVPGGCRNCKLKEVSGHLRNAGYDSAICKSKWKSSPEVPSGEHTYLDVIHKSSSSKQMEVRMIIELNFRAEFEMARASEEYNALIGRLPEVFVGKAERLRNLIKILCSAAKKCTKEKKMHMGPWRRHGYMKAKWFGACERTQSQKLPEHISHHRPMKAKASLLAFDLLEMMPSLQHLTSLVVANKCDNEAAQLTHLLEGIIFREEEDSIHWETVDRIFSVKECATKISEVRRVCESLGIPGFRASRIWVKEVPPRVNFFTWLLIRGRLVTDDFLKHTGNCVPSRCELCGCGEEIVEHLFYSCIFSSDIWNSFLIGSRQFGVSFTSLEDLIYNWRGSNLSTVGRKYWRLLPYAVLWNLWLTRNKSKFEGMKAIDWRVMQGIKNTVWSWGLEDKVLHTIRLEDLMFRWDSVITN